MSVRIRMKKMGRTHRPFFRICAMDRRAPRDGRVLEELGTYDPNVSDTDARAVLKADRINYWLSVGAQPSENVSALIKKYGTDGSHLEEQKTALERLAQPRVIADPGKPASLPKPVQPKEEAASDQAPTEQASLEGADEQQSAQEEVVPSESKSEGSKGEQASAAVADSSDAASPEADAGDSEAD